MKFRAELDARYLVSNPLVNSSAAFVQSDVTTSTNTVAFLTETI